LFLLGFFVFTWPFSLARVRVISETHRSDREMDAHDLRDSKTNTPTFCQG
jgi:hypothetical protein